MLEASPICSLFPPWWLVPDLIASHRIASPRITYGFLSLSVKGSQLRGYTVPYPSLRSGWRCRNTYGVPQYRGAQWTLFLRTELAPVLHSALGYRMSV